MSQCLVPLLILDSVLENWKVIGSGGFGQIYKTKHRKWCCDVAVKLLHHDDGSSTSLLREVDMMRRGSSPYVIQVLGVFRGRVPPSGPSTHLGLVMEFMERGSLATMQETLQERPPWPLAFRLAHQAALGINFLHSLTPPMLHLDLKPSNVLLDSSLNAKLTDFGLARLYHSVTRSSKKDSDDEGGTISYMPPEAFNVSYSPTQASDIYSYGILLWSIVTGKQPYPHAMSSIVRFRIPRGDRPSLDEVQGGDAAGLTGLIQLMQRCWEQRPDHRPTSHECTTVTEDLYKMHKPSINDAVYQVLKKLNQQEEDGISEQVQRVHISPPAVPGDQTHPPIQEVARGVTVNHKGKAQFKVSDPFVTRPASPPVSTGFKPKASSVHPIRSSPPRLNQTRTDHPAMRKNVIQQFQRQVSSPDTVCMSFCNVVGVQVGNNNNMWLQESVVDRKRHPTAPSRVNLPPPRPTGGKNKTGGAS